MATKWTIDGVKAALAAKKVSAREITTAFYKSIEARNGELNAYLALSPERAYAQADKIDALVLAAFL
jgi:aspartyl-tRNA(Asn)/glutamyl-tRNA(Gln) amidotransferase subunit A